MLIFFAILLRSYEDARQCCCKSTLIKTAARQGCCETRKAFVRLTTELALTHFAHKCSITVQRPCALLNGCHKNHTNRMNPQVLAFQKSWRSFSPITVCIIAQCQCRTGGGWGHVPLPPHEEAAVSVLKKFCAFICTVMVWWCLGCFGVVWGISRP